MKGKATWIAPGLALFLALWIAPAPPAFAAAGDTVADAVLGQRRMTTSLPFFVDGRIFGAADVAIDRSVEPNRLYLADADLNRVLGWSDVGRFRAGVAADLVLGQPSLFVGAIFYTRQACPSPPSATSFCKPSRLAVDPAGNLYVADAFNDRVLEFDRPFDTDRVADRVFGQPDFNTRGTVPQPLDMAVDAAGNLWMLDPARAGRILELDAPPTHDTQPDRVIEPPTSGECATTSSRPGACSPSQLTLSPQGDLYVQDYLGDLYVYRQPLATDLALDFRLPGFYWGAAFDPAGDLYAINFQGLQRFAAPVAPDTRQEYVFGLGSTDVSVGQLDFDSAGHLYLADGPVHVFNPPYRSEPAKVQREVLSNRGLMQPDAVAVDRTSRPNHLYVFDANGRVLAWRDAAGLASGAPADLVLTAGISPAVNVSITHGLAVDPRGNLWVSGVSRVVEFDRPFDTDLVPDRSLGQRCNAQGTGPGCLSLPGGLAFDRQGRLYVADLEHNRVLLFADPLRSDLAVRVLGQADFQGRFCNRGNAAPDAASLCLGINGSPDGPEQFRGSGALAVDPQGNLYVADSLNNRVLIFKDPWRTDRRADAVLGQDRKLNTRFQGAGPHRFAGSPAGLAVGRGGDLYVADTQNDRLLVFTDPLRDDTPDRVFGHADFETGGTPGGTLEGFPQPTASRLLRPTGLAFDADGNLYVADTGYNRVLRFDRP